MWPSRCTPARTGAGGWRGQLRGCPVHPVNAALGRPSGKWSGESVVPPALEGPGLQGKILVAHASGGKGSLLSSVTWASKGMMFACRGHLAISGNSCGSHRLGKVLLESSG